MNSTKEISVREAANKLGICLDAAYALVWAGKLAGVKRDGRWWIPVSAIENRLKERNK